MFVKLFARNSGAGNGCANFMGAWNKSVLSAGKTHAHKIPPFRGGYFGFGGGGESADFIFMGAGIFLKVWLSWNFPIKAVFLRDFPSIPPPPPRPPPICTFHILLSWNFQRKTVFLRDFPSICPPPPPRPPLQNAYFISIVASAFLIILSWTDSPELQHFLQKNPLIIITSKKSRRK